MTEVIGSISACILPAATIQYNQFFLKKECSFRAHPRGPGGIV
jgi:hypothetical protein